MLQREYLKLETAWFRTQKYRSWWAQREHITVCFFDLL